MLRCAMNIALPTRMTVDEFLAWAARQESGRYELFDGRVIMQLPQGWGHADLCWRIRGLLTAAITQAGVPYYSAPMGMTVRITEKRAFEPDVLVAPLPEPRQTDLEIPNPVIVVEVLSPSTASRDQSEKVAGYAQVPCIQHYLIVDLEKHQVAWHRRAAGGAFAPPISVHEGALELDPPGITLAIAEIFAPDP
jgi:Uma2 family endonuclease